MAKNNLPVPRFEGDASKEIANLRDAGSIGGPVSSFFYSVGQRAGTRALQAAATRARAFEDSANAHGGAIKALIGLRDTIDDYEARSEFAADHYQLAQERSRAGLAQERLRLRKQAADSEWEALEAEAKRDAKAQLTPRQIELGSTRLEGRIADAGITTAIHKSALAEHAAQRKGNGGTDDDMIQAFDELIATQTERRHEAASNGDYDTAAGLDKSITAAIGAKAVYLATVGGKKE